MNKTLGTEITNFEIAIEYFKGKYSDLVENVLVCLRSRIKVQHTDLLSHVLTLLTPIGWDKSQDGSFAYSSLDYLTEWFLVPLQKENVNTSLMKEEWDDMTDYARWYFNLVDSYRVIWWELFNCTESGNWTNILALVALLFCLPASNGKVERIFSRLKNIKSIRRTSLGEEKLDELLRITETSQWQPASALKLWWDDKTRRTRRTVRAVSTSEGSTLVEEETTPFNLGVCIHWTGLLDWTTGLDYWTDL